MLKNLNPKKATGYDNIPPKLLRLASMEFSRPIATLVNSSIKRSHFPESLKQAEVTPLHKSKDSLERGNYRPLSILSSISKIYDRTYYNQLYSFFHELFDNMLSAYRPKYGCQHVLIKLIEDWKQALENEENVGAIFMDLSKAFDCISHRLLLGKLHAYGVSEEACALIKSYLQNRKQRVKLGNFKSGWAHLKKGVPQGSILGPLLFNVFLNDIFYHLNDMCPLYNYADDNTLSFCHKSIQILKQTLEGAATHAITWFENNEMQANPVKFQCFVITKKSMSDSIDFHISDKSITADITAKLLGVYIDTKLNFEEHVSRLCKRASWHINAISRVSKYLDKKSRLKLFYAFVLADFQYCNIIWHFCGKASQVKMEKLQKRALQIVLHDYQSDYCSLLNEVQRPSLYSGRLKTIALETYKIINNISPSFLYELFTRNEVPYGLRDSNRLVIPKTRTVKFGQNSLRYQGAKIWNLLPNDIKEIGDLASFKYALDKWPGITCACGDCITCTINRM